MQDDLTVCPLQNNKNAQLLLDYCSRRLDLAQSQAIEKHISICPACQRFRDGQRAVWSALDTWDQADFTPGFDMRMREKLEAEDRRPIAAKIGIQIGSWLDGISMKPALPLAAVFFVWMAGWQVWKPGNFSLIPNPNAASIEQLDADRRPAVEEELSNLRELSESERDLRFRSPEMQQRFSEREREILKKILGLVADR